MNHPARAALALCLIMAGCSSQPVPSTPTKYANDREMAAAAYAKRKIGDLDGAIRVYDDAILLEPNRFTHYINRADIKIEQGDFAGAIRDCDAALRLDGKARALEAAAYSTRATAQRHSKNYDAAIADYTEAIAFDPRDSSAYLYRGQAKRWKGDLDGALDDYRRVLFLFPDDAEVYNSIGNIYRLKGDLPNAIQNFSHAIQLEKNFGIAWSNRASAKKALGELNDSLSDYVRAVELRPNHVDTLTSLAGVHQLLGNYSEAISAYDKAIALAKEDDAYTQIFRSLLRQRMGRSTVAKDLAPALPKWTDDWEKSIGLYLSGKLSEARLFENAAKGKPQRLRAQQCECFYYVAMHHLLQGDNEAARRHLESCVAISDANVLERDFAKAELSRLTAAPSAPAR